MNRQLPLKFLLAIFCLVTLMLVAHLACAEDIQLVKVRKGDTVSYLSFKIYGQYNQRIYDLLQKENPAVADLNVIYAGQELRFPAPAAMKMLLADAKPQPQEPAAEPRKETPETARLAQVKASAQKAVITYLEGQVQVMKGTGSPWVAAAPNSILYAKDEIRVLAKSRAELILDNQSVMRLSENTRLALRQLDVDAASRKETTSVGLSLGKLWTKASKVFNPSSRMEVRTPTAIAGVQGTVYQVNVESERRTDIRVYDGAVAVYQPFPSAGPSAGGPRPMLAPQKVQGPKSVDGPQAVSREVWTEIILRKAQQMTVTDSGVPRPVAFDIEQERKSEWVRWNESRDADFRPPKSSR